jgi:hypothetical protein
MTPLKLQKTMPTGVPHPQPTYFFQVHLVEIQFKYPVRNPASEGTGLEDTKAA